VRFRSRDNTACGNASDHSSVRFSPLFFQKQLTTALPFVNKMDWEILSLDSSELGGGVTGASSRARDAALREPVFISAQHPGGVAGSA
jgi:hypothetical protein